MGLKLAWLEAIFLFLGFQAGDRWADQAVLRIKQAGGGAASPSSSYAPGPKNAGGWHTEPRNGPGSSSGKTWARREAGGCKERIATATMSRRMDLRAIHS